MTNLAGFDAVAEFGPAALLAALRGDPRLAALMPPFERRQTVVAPGGNAEGHFIFDDMSIVLVPPSSVGVRLHFSGSSVIGASIPRDFIRQSGHFQVTVPVALETGATPDERRLRLQIGAATVGAVFDGPTPSGHSLIRTLIANGIRDEVRALETGGPIAVPLPIRVDPANPSLQPLRVADLRLALFNDGTRQSLALFMAFAPGGGGNPALRTTADLPAGADFALTIGAAAFRDVVLVPAFQNLLRVGSRAQLPREFGTAERVGLPEEAGPPEAPGTPIARTNNLLERLSASLDTGGVRVQIQARTPSSDGGAFGADQVAAITGHIGLRLAGGRLEADWSTIGVDAWHDYGWGWWLTGIFGPFLTMIIVEAVTHRLAHVFGSGISFDVSGVATPLPAPLPGLSFSRVDVSPAELSLAGTAAVRTMAPRMTLTATGETTESDLRQTGAGTYQSEGCPVGSYNYTLWTRRQRAVFQASATFEHSPATYRWSVHAGGVDHILSGRGEVGLRLGVTRPGPPSSYEFPVDVSLGFVADGPRLELQAPADDGMFTVNVRCLATDASGRQASWSQRLPLATRLVDFSGTSWDRDLDECIRGLRARLVDVDRIAARSGLERPFRLPGGGLRIDLAKIIGPEMLASIAARADKHHQVTLANMAIQRGTDLTAPVATLSSAALKTVLSGTILNRKLPPVVGKGGKPPIMPGKLK